MYIFKCPDFSGYMQAVNILTAFAKYENTFILKLETQRSTDAIGYLALMQSLILKYLPRAWGESPEIIFKLTWE